MIVNNTTGGQFDFNGQRINGHGLSITSNGAVTLTNINASANHSDGLMVDTKGPVTIIYTKEAWVNDNGANGIWVYTLGAIKLTSTSKLHAENNYANGIYLSNSGATAPINVEGLTDKISQIRAENNGRGIDIYSNEIVTVHNAAAFYNAGSGFYIGDTTYKPSAINMTNIIAQGNGNGIYPSGDCNGVTIYAKGPVNIFNLDSNQSAGNGLWVETAGAVIVKKILTSWNGMRVPEDNFWGIHIVTPGNVILDSIRSNADDNSVLVDTYSGSGTVTMLGTYFKNEIINSAVLNGYALLISSNGNVTLNRLDLRGNAGYTEIFSFAGKVILNNVKAQNNVSGIYTNARTGADFIGVISMNNGWYDSDGDGIPEAYSTDGIYVDLFGGTASFTDSIFTGNTESGIEIYLGTPTATYKLLRTIYFGNDSDNVGGERNLLAHN